MPRSASEALVEKRLAEGEEGGGRFIDIRADLVRETTGELLLVAGGRWDRRDKRMADEPARTRRVLKIQEAQLDAARWFARWFEARRISEYLYTDEGKPIFSVALVGGRRAGKSDLGIKIVATYAVENPRSIVWIVVPVMTDSPEVDRVLEEILPAQWYAYLGDPWFLYTLENGSEIHIKSSAVPKGLKKGRVDVVLINEAQNHPQRTYAMVRPAIADRGGLVILAANPPENSAGMWVEEYVERANGGRIGGRVFILDPDLNPHVDSAALLSIADEVDERTYEREIRGTFGLPRTDAVFFAFSQPFNVERAPEHAGVTVPFLNRKLGVPADRLHGMDFQIEPWQCAGTFRFFEDPKDPMGDPLPWLVDEAFVEQGLEDDLIDLLESHWLPGDGGVKLHHSSADPVVPDASGDWQDSIREKGRSSWGALRRRGWRRLFHPDPDAKKNPSIEERVAVGNSLFKSASGLRKLRIDPVRCPRTIRAVKLWALKHGVPDRRSEHAHAADHLTYPLYRLFPRRTPGGRIEYARIERGRSARYRDMEVF